MAEISDAMHASAVFDAARQELAWAYSGDFTDVPEPMKGAVHTISELLNKAEMRGVTSTRESMAAVVATGDGEKNKKWEDVEVVKEMDMRSVEEAKRKIKSWLVDLEKVACDMRAVARKELLGDYSKMDDDKLSAGRFSCLPRTSRAARIAPPTIDTVALELERLKEQYHKEFGHSAGLPLAATSTEKPASSSAAGGQEETETSVAGDLLVERDDDVKMRIINIINRKVEQYVYSRDDIAIILPIIGPRCVGKTALVKSVFHEGSFFGAGYKVWVDMRKGWDIKEIHESIMEVVGRDHFDDGYYERGRGRVWKVESEEDYGSYIHQMLALKKTRLLLVLDNLQVEEQDLSMLDELLIFLRYDHRSAIIAIMITWSEDLAQYIASRSLIPEYRLHPSSDYMCWEIIKRTSGLDLKATAAGEAVALSEIDGREIASKCLRIPFAAKALGRFLQPVHPKEWPGLIRDVWNVGGGFSSDSQKLQRLPIHIATVFTYLKHSRGVLGESWLSLAYCAFVFSKGKGHGVAACDLLNQWCSLGITTPEGGAACIRKLLDRLLILDEGPPNSNASTEAATLLTMEDLMHNFARYLLGDRLIVVDGKNGATPSTSSLLNNESSRGYLALVRNFDAKQLDISNILPAGILALRFDGCGEMELSDGAFASFGKYLRLLDLSGCSEKKTLPEFIRHLKQLRYLKAPGIQDQELPRSITGLHELRYLILQGSCQLEDLTKAFQWLSNLLHLDLSGCTKLKALPDSFGRLWRLEHLDLSSSGIEALPESLGWLRNLRHMDLSGLSGLQALPMVSLPRKLRHLNLSGCSGLQEKQLPGAPEPNELRHLDLSGCSSLCYLPESYTKLEKLVFLNLSGCSRLKKLPHVDNKFSWRKLEHLDLSCCSSLKYLAKVWHSDHSEVQNLKYLDLSGCSRMGRESRLVETIRSRGGRASGPKDAPLQGQGTNGTTN